MKLTLKLKPDALFALKTIIEDEIEEATKDIEYYSRPERHEESWSKTNLEFSKRRLENANMIHEAFIEGVDTAVTLFDFAKSAEE